MKKKIVKIMCCFGTMLLFIFIAGGGIAGFYEAGYWYDASDYWGRGVLLWKDGKFDLLNLGNAFRGYIFPLYLGMCSFVGGEHGPVVYILVNSFLLSLLFVLAIPKLHEASESKNSPIHLFLFLLMFYGLARYALSDLFAVGLCIVATIMERMIYDSNSILKSIWKSILFGIVLYLMYNTRTIYLFPAIYLLGLFLFHTCKVGGWKQKVGKVLFCFIGVFIAGLPQLYVNYMVNGIKSIAVLTNGLMLKQLYWGMYCQRYEGYIGEGIDVIGNGIWFMDEVGFYLLAQHGIQTFNTWKEYIKFVILHFFDVVGIYMRHFINILFPCWPNLYIEDINNNKIFMLILSYSCIFLVCYSIFNKCIKSYRVFSNYIPLAIPMVLMIPAAVETRFFVALYILGIGMLCYNVSWSKMWECFKTSCVRTCIIFIIGGGFLVSQWSYMLISHPEYRITFNWCWY